MGKIVRGVCIGLLASSVAAAKAVLSPLPPGSTLPVVLMQPLDSKHVRAGMTVAAKLSQRVPLNDRDSIPQGARLSGQVNAVSDSQLSITWTELQAGRQTEPVKLKCVAIADWFDVAATADPIGGPTHSTSDWTTVQIGGDEVYGVNVATAVYDRYSQRVGRADGTGVYAPPIGPGLPERAMGPFSTTARGVYDIPGVTIRAAGGGAPMVLGLQGPDWKVRRGSALLLEAVSP